MTYDLCVKNCKLGIELNGKLEYMKNSLFPIFKTFLPPLQPFTIIINSRKSTSKSTKRHYF